MPFSVELELEDGGFVMYDNVIAYTVEETEDEPSPDEVPEEGEEEREGNQEPDMMGEDNPMYRGTMQEEENNN